MSIDVVRMCRKHGQIDTTFRIGGRDFCEKCLADKLVELGLDEAKMKTIDRERALHGPKVKCESCGGDRPHTQDACPICGHQATPDP